MLKLIPEESKMFISIKEKEALIIDINAIQKLIDYSGSISKKIIAHNDSNYLGFSKPITMGVKNTPLETFIVKEESN